MPNAIPIAQPSSTDRIAIVVARWKEAITRKLLDDAVAELKKHGVADDGIGVASYLSGE